MATCRLHPAKNAGVERVRKAVSPAIEKALTKIGLGINREVVSNLSGKVLHVRSGTLRASWFMPGPIVERIVGGWRMKMGSDVPYARIHELGGWTGRGHKTKIPKRPYLRPALISQAENIRAQFAGMFFELKRLW